MSSDKQSVTLHINSDSHELMLDGGETLLVTVRERLGLTGSKRGCNQGVCGACTMLVDGEPMRGCLLLSSACSGREITTIEGIADGLNLTPIQEAMVKFGGLQCGFCTSGMVLTLSAFLAENRSPTREEVRHALSGNLCRCTGYTKIVDAAMSVAEEHVT
ncbi:MAG: carbon-monoxide dehydrogenase small subunit [Gammaproteobacteria bacterium]|jgi:carbon-monoxide dehydrogenase small subunit